MTFRVKRASNPYLVMQHVDIQTIEDLKKFDADNGFNSLIIEFSDVNGNEYKLPQITIYDDYVE